MLWGLMKILSLELPKEGEFMSLNNFKNQPERQFVEWNILKSEKNVLNTHELNSVALYFVWTYNNNDLWSYVEIDCATKLLIKLNELAEHGIEEMTTNHKIIMSDEDYDDFDNATCCHISNRKVHHLTK